MPTHNIVSISGGKDSTATLLVARELEVPNLSAVVADTARGGRQFDMVDLIAAPTARTTAHPRTVFVSSLSTLSTSKLLGI
ncbi:hypothetical protein D3C73_1356090 [compost metagenome]